VACIFGSDRSSFGSSSNAPATRIVLRGPAHAPLFDKKHSRIPQRFAQNFMGPAWSVASSLNQMDLGRADRAFAAAHEQAARHRQSSRVALLVAFRSRQALSINFGAFQESGKWMRR
jgi:hypothetical protein